MGILTKSIHIISNKKKTRSVRTMNLNIETVTHDEYYEVIVAEIRYFIQYTN